MFSLYRKCYNSFSTCCHIYFSCMNSASRNSTINLGHMRLYGRGVKDELIDDFKIRSLTHDEVPQLMDLMEPVNRTDPEPSLHSWLKKEPHGIKVAVTERDGIVGSCSSVNNADGDDAFFFGGLLFVKPEHQKKNIGRMLYDSCLQRAGSHNAGVNAVPGKLEIYRSSGFPIHDTRFTTIEYLTTSWPLDFSFLASSPPPGISIHPFHSSHLPAIYAYDFRLLGFKRTTALSLSLMEVGTRTLVAVYNDGSCAGFGMIKDTCGGGVRVGPLYADRPEVADVLLRRLLEVVEMESMKVFGFVTTSANRHATRWMDRLGVGVFEVCDRVYTKKTLDVDLDKVYGLCDSNFSPF